jgi:hypothetical protein
LVIYFEDKLDVLKEKSYHHILRLAALVFVLVGLFEIYPGNYRIVSSESNQYLMLKEKISHVPDPKLLILPETGFDRIIQSHLNFPMMNPIFPVAGGSPEINLLTSLGPVALAEHLRFVGVTHAISIRQNPFDNSVSPWNKIYLDYDLGLPGFKLIASSKVFGSYQAEDLVLDTYQVLPGRASDHSKDEVGTSRSMVTFEGSFSADGPVLWSLGDVLRMNVTRYDLQPTLTDRSKFDRSNMISLYLTAISNQRVLLTSTSGEKRIVDLQNGVNTRVDLTGVAQLNWSVNIVAIDKCSSPSQLSQGNDPRILCFGITKTNSKYPIYFSE